MGFIVTLSSSEGGTYLHGLQGMDVFSRYGVVFLLFRVGLDSCVAELRQVGSDSVCVAVVGVVASATVGFGDATRLLPGVSGSGHLFLVATLCTTSIGITARVLSDLNQTHSQECQIVLGAAVLGLILLAIVSGIVVIGSVGLWVVARTTVLAVLFIIGSVVLSPYLVRFLVWLFYRMDILETKLFVSFIFATSLAWIVNMVGLAEIVGTFAAGLLNLDSHFKPCTRYHLHDKYNHNRTFCPP